MFTLFDDFVLVLAVGAWILASSERNALSVPTQAAKSHSM